MKRFFQQNVPKCISKASKVQSIKVASFHNFGNKIHTNQIPSLFTTCRYKNSKAIPTLPDLLAAEIAEEKSNDEIDEDLEKEKKLVLKSFKITDQKGLGIVKLARTYKDEVIEIAFNCQDEEEIDELERDFNEIEGDEDAEAINEDGNSTGIRFEVCITKGDSKVVIDCVAMESLVIGGIRCIVGDHSSDGVYGGPIFSELDERLQTAIYEYLNERAINDNLSNFVLNYSSHKEQKEYVNWLENIHAFTSK